MAPLHTPQSSLLYRQRAEELRTIAGDMADSNSKKIILSIAVEYDRMANALVELDAIAPDPEPPSGQKARDEP
jgi:hypothetical protein